MAEEKSLGKMISALDFIRTEVGELGIQQMMLLLTIFEEERITQYDLTERYNFQQGSVSKNCKKLSQYEVTDPRTGKNAIIGLDLIKLIPSVTEFRKLECHLTERGEKIRKELLERLK